MTNYLELGANTLQDRMEVYGGVEVTYSRPGVFAFQIVAIPGRNPTDVLDQNGLVLRSQMQDFIVNIEKLVAKMSDPKRPQRNDEIRHSINGVDVIFTVNGEDFSTSHYEAADSYGVAWRIHTKADRPG